MASSHNSTVRQYFTVNSVVVFQVSCNLCKASLARSGKGSKHSYGTSNLRKHLQSKHSTEHCNLVAEEQKLQLSVPVDNHLHRPTTNTLVKAFDAKRPWDFDDERSQCIQRLIGEMTALDDQPFNIVNN